MERDIRKILTFVISWIASKIFRENKPEALVISKRLKFPQNDRTDTNFIAPLKCTSRDLKVLWIALEVFSVYSGGSVVGCPLDIPDLSSSFIFYSDIVDADLFVSVLCKADLNKIHYKYVL